MAETAEMSPVELAQASGDVPIGSVDAVEGSATVVRTNGDTETISTGTSIFQGDTVTTGADSNVSILFVDETTFALDGDGEMTIDEMVFDPDASTGSALFSVAEGVFTLVSGQIAKTDPDAMTLTTPIATIGIRGTAVAGQGGPEGFPNFFTLMPEPGGIVGEIVISNDVGVQILGAAFQTTQMTSAFVPPSVPVVISQTAASRIYGAVGRSFVTKVNNADAANGNNGDDGNGDGNNNDGGGDGTPQTPEEAAAQAAEDAAASAFEEALELGASIDEAFALAGEAAINASIEAFFDASGADEFFLDPGFDPATGAGLFASTLGGAFDALVGGAGEDNLNDAFNEEFGGEFDFFGQEGDLTFFTDFGFGDDEFFVFDDDTTDDFFFFDDETAFDDSNSSGTTLVELTGGVGNDTLTATTDAELITTGDGYDSIEFTSLLAMQDDVIADFIPLEDSRTQSDVLKIDAYGFELDGATLFYSGNSINPATAFDYSYSTNIQGISSTGDFTTSYGKNLLVFYDSSFNSASSIQSAINTGGGTVITFSNTAQTGNFLAMYDNGIDTKVALIEFSSAVDTSSATVTDVMTLEGVDVALMSGSDVNYTWSGPAPPA